MGFLDRALGELIKAALVPDAPRRPRRGAFTSQQQSTQDNPDADLGGVRIFLSAIGVFLGFFLLLKSASAELDPEAPRVSLLIFSAGVLALSIRGLWMKRTLKSKQSE